MLGAWRRRKRIRKLIVRLSDRLSEEDSEIACSLNKAGEFGEALDVLFTQVYEHGKKLTPEEYEMAKILIEELNLDPRMLEGLV